MEIQRVLVPVDFSDDSIEALEVALAYFQDARIYLVNITEESRPKTVNPEQIAEEQFSSAKQDEAHLRLRDLAHEYPAEAHRIEPVVLGGEPVDGILEAADIHGAELIVMSLHGASGLGKSLFGSTTYSVSRKAECSVWVVKGRVPKKRSKAA